MQQENNVVTSDQLSMRDAVRLLAKHRNFILKSSLLGLALAGLYVAITPKVFEARWQVAMAKMSSTNTYAVINAEEPAALMQRLRSPTTYSDQVLEVCGYAKDKEEMNDYLNKALQVQVVKNVADVVDFRLRAESVAQVKRCADALVAMVIEQQRNIIQEQLVGRQDQLMQYQQSLQDEMHQLGRINKTEMGNFGYLAELGKLSWLRTRIDQLQVEISLSQKRPATLISPLEVSNKPVSPKLLLVLILGWLLGFIIGVVVLMVREGWKPGIDQAKISL
jgi:capsular polysaccharide biosynthesis protein